MRTRFMQVVAGLAVIYGLCGGIAQAAVVAYDMAVKGSICEAASWVGGVLPGSNDVVLVRNTASDETVTFDFTNEVRWAGLIIDAPISKDLTVSLNGSGTLFLGSEGIATSSANIKTINLVVAVSLSADQTWLFQSGALNRPTGYTYLNGRVLTVDGTVKKELKQSLVGPGSLQMTGSYLVFTDGIYADEVDLVLDMKNVPSFVDFNDWSSAPLAKSLTVESDGTFRIYSNSEWRFTTNTLASAITVRDGMFRFAVERTRTPKMLFSAPGLARERGMVLFRGTALGTSPVSVTDTQAVNIVFDSAPELLGEASGSGTTVPVLAGAAVDTAAGGFGEGFGTYDAVYGVRLLDPAAEYTAAITDGQSSLDNVRYDNPGAGPVETALTAPVTTINSLTLTEAGGAGACGIAVTASASATLKIHSGMIFANQSMTETPTTADALVLQVPNLDFNGKDGLVFLRETKYTSNGYCNAPLRFRSSPTNTSANGISFYAANSSATPYVYFDGDQTNTYTGPVTFGGRLYVRLEKGIPNNAILGTLIVNGASCQFDHELADDADIVLKAGSVTIKTGQSNSGNSGSENYRDLTLYGGTYTHGGGGGGTATFRNARLFGGQMTQGRGTLATVTGDVTLAGCALVLASNGDSNRSGTRVLVSGEVAISNTVGRTPYAAIHLGYSWYRNPAYVSLTNRLAVYGNAVNTNGVAVTRVYNADSRTMLGELRLNDAVEFLIDDGAADFDFDVDASLMDNGALGGELVKTGEGTLRLTASTNALSGGMQVADGRLVMDGGAITDIAVASGAVLAGGGQVEGEVAFAAGAVFQVRASDGEPVPVLSVAGAVSGGPAAVEVVGAPEAPALILAATEGITASFATAAPGLGLSLKAGGTELWLVKRSGTLIAVK